MAFFFNILVLLQPHSHPNRASTSSGTVALKWTAGMHVQPGSSGAAVRPTVYPFLGPLLRVTVRTGKACCPGTSEMC